MGLLVCSPDANASVDVKDEERDDDEVDHDEADLPEDLKLATDRAVDG